MDLITVNFVVVSKVLLFQFLSVIYKLYAEVKFMYYYFGHRITTTSFNRRWKLSHQVC